MHGRLIKSADDDELLVSTITVLDDERSLERRDPVSRSLFFFFGYILFSNARAFISTALSAHSLGDASKGLDRVCILPLPSPDSAPRGAARSRVKEGGFYSRRDARSRGEEKTFYAPHRGGKKGRKRAHNA